MMKNSFLLLFLMLASISGNPCIAQQAQISNTKTLDRVYPDCFLISVAAGTQNLVGDEGLLMKKQLNRITGENAIKMESLQSEEGQFYWKHAHRIGGFAIKK